MIGSERPAGAPAEVVGVLFDEETIRSRVVELAVEIADDHAGHEIVLVTVLRGGLYFLADLCRSLPDPVRLDFMSISSYGPGDRTGGVRITKDMDEDIKGKHVVLVEDIVDTGLTLNYLLGVLRSRGPASLSTVALLDRDHLRIADVPVTYRGFRMPDVFAVGYGLDYRGFHRNLRYLGILDPDILDAPAAPPREF